MDGVDIGHNTNAATRGAKPEIVELAEKARGALRDLGGNLASDRLRQEYLTAQQRFENKSNLTPKQAQKLYEETGGKFNYLTRQEPIPGTDKMRTCMRSAYVDLGWESPAVWNFNAGKCDDNNPDRPDQEINIAAGV